MKLYRYVGPKEIADRARGLPSGHPIFGSNDVRDWIDQTRQDLVSGYVVATFVVDESGTLRIADRRSEHVACAAGKPVESAGEITFSVGKSIAVIEATNQSTGYCPEPESWPAVAASLARANINGPTVFDPAFVFRRCERCTNITLVKNNIYCCGMCDAAISLVYNVQ